MLARCYACSSSLFFVLIKEGVRFSFFLFFDFTVKSCRTCEKDATVVAVGRFADTSCRPVKKDSDDKWL